MEAEAPLLVAVTSLPGAAGGAATAAAVGVAVARMGAREPLGVVVVDTESSSRPRPTLVSSAAARGLESRLRTDLPAVARGAICAVTATRIAPGRHRHLPRVGRGHGRRPRRARTLERAGRYRRDRRGRDSRRHEGFPAPDGSHRARPDQRRHPDLRHAAPARPGRDTPRARRNRGRAESSGSVRSALRPAVRARAGRPGRPAHAVSRLGDGGRGDASRDPGLGRYGRVALPARGRPGGGVGGALSA